MKHLLCYGFIAALSFSQCGLAIIQYLNPVTSTTDGSETVSFINDTGNTNTFDGFEIYYKIYKDPSESAVINDKNTIASAELPGVSPLTSNGYRRLENAGISSLPLVPMEPLNEYKVEISFSEYLKQDDAEPVIHVFDSSDNMIDIISIRRSAVFDEDITDDQNEVVYEKGQYKPFLKQYYMNSDEDLTAVDITSDILDISFFVVAYGLSVQIENVYSSATHIGTIDNIYGL